MGLREAVRNAAEFAKATKGKSSHRLDVPWDVPVEETQEWGLVLPGGAVMWNSWQGIPFHSAVDRVHMIATLQKTADEVGFDPKEFLARYNWVTRTRISAVAYEEGTSLSLNAPEVSEPEGEPS